MANRRIVILLTIFALTIPAITKRSDIDYLNMYTEMYASKVPSECRPCDDYGMFMLLLFPQQKRYIYRGDISIMQTGSYIERNDSLFLNPSTAIYALSDMEENAYIQHVYTSINDTTQSNVVTRPKLFVRQNNGDIAEVLKNYKFKVYEYEGRRYVPITETIGNLDFHEFPQEIRDSIMATMTKTHIVYQRVKLSE